MDNSKKKSPLSVQQKLSWVAAGIGLLAAGNAIYHELTKYNLHDRVVLITGGSRGLGLVLARQLAAKGARLAICARSQDQLEKARLELEGSGIKVLTIQADVSKQEEVRNLIYAVIRHYGKLDVLINNAGIIQVGPVQNMTVEDYENVMQTNFWGPLYTIQATLPHFMERGSGRIINISSIGGKFAIPHLVPYSASKFALTGLSEGMHAELKKYNIHVTTVVPNLMRTGSARNIDVKGNHEAEYAWFKTSGSSPLLSQKAEHAAKNIIRAIEYGDAEVILTLTAKVAHVVKGLAPGWINTLLAISNRFLPDPVETGFETKKGYEAETNRSKGPVAAISDRAAIVNNEH